MPSPPDNPGSDPPPSRGEHPTPPGARGHEEPYADALVELNALLGRGTHYAGKLHFEGRVRIEGRFEGEIRGEDVLVIGQGAEIDGSIEVGACIVTGGSVRASIRARDAIELHAPAVVWGDLHAPNIFIDRGVQFEGQCRMAPLDATSTPPPVQIAQRDPEAHDPPVADSHPRGDASKLDAALAAAEAARAGAPASAASEDAADESGDRMDQD